MPAEIHVNNIGTVFQATIKDQDGVIVDVSMASPLTMTFRVPTVPFINRAKAATLVSGGVDGRIKYTSVADFLDTPGDWEVQGYAKIGSSEFYSDLYTFKVYPNL